MLKISSQLLIALAILLSMLTITLAHGSQPPQITITIDDTVITQLLKMIASHDDTSASIDSWIHLPGNKELLKVGDLEQVMTESQLRENVKAVIDGTASNENQPLSSFGRIYMPSTQDYSAMLDELHKNSVLWLSTSAQRDAIFSPDNINVKQTVYLHLGGDWDAINKDGAIYINMAYFHDNFSPSWSGLNMLIAHETFHAVQNQAYGNPEKTDTPDDAFFTALSKIQREGTARYVEVDTDLGGYTQGTYGFFFRGIDEESLREFPTTLPLLSNLTLACFPSINYNVYQDEIAKGLGSGGPYYTLGEGIAAAIDKYYGRKRLIRTVSNGPLDFFDCYATLCNTHYELPKLPQDALDQIQRLKSENVQIIR